MIIDFENEVWVPVIGASKYMVSNFSRIQKDQKLIAKQKDSNGYACITIYTDAGDKKSMCVYAIVFWSFNTLLKKVKGYEIDHDDQDKTNDHLNNLNYVLSRVNSTNRSLAKPKTSKYTGVSLCDRKNQPFVAHIRVKQEGKSKTVYLGRFAKEDDAGKAYKHALHKINLGFVKRDDLIMA